MRQDDRAPFTAALDRARRTAYPPGQYAGQESFLRARDIRRIARHAAIDADSTVLDLCCGVAGPGRLIAAETGCDYVGVDSSPGALQIAAQRCAGLRCRFVSARIPPLPQVDADVMLLLSTMLAFEDKTALIEGVARALRPGGRFAFTVEIGTPLTPEEAAAMPDSDTVWLVEEPDLLAALQRAGLSVEWAHDASTERGVIAGALLDAYCADGEAIAGGVGRAALDDLVAAHRLWTTWFATGRVRDLEIVVRPS